MKAFWISILSLIFFSSCKKSTSHPTNAKLLWRIEKNQVGVSGQTYVSYFNYDNNKRVIQASLYLIDSLSPSLDSILIQKYNYQYSDLSNNPTYVKWYYTPSLPVITYSLFESWKYYSNSRLVYDSTNLIGSNPPQSVMPELTYYTYPSGQIARKSYSGNTVISIDTFFINSDNVIKSSLWQYNFWPGTGINNVMTYVFDDKINPVAVPWIEQSHSYTVLSNKNNITSATLTSVNGWIRWVSQYQYDSDGYPVKQIENLSGSSPIFVQVNNIITYHYQ